MQEKCASARPPKLRQSRMIARSGVKSKSKWGKGQFRCKLRLLLSLQMHRKMCSKPLRLMPAQTLLQPAACKALDMAPARAWCGSDLA